MLPVLPEEATQGDLDATYHLRGQSILLCNDARKLAVEWGLAQREMNEAWAARKRRPDPG